ncbi:MAG: polysulfide reductase NrfD [Acidimicrobiia bacterium]|nr:polysulfide reductase NrfD [Acidimicrobiia bacterium]
MKTRERAMVPRAEPRTYYDRPVLKKPVWRWYIPAYFFSGGMAGASSTLAFAARLRGNHQLARRAGLIALGGMAVSPVFLIADLGRPGRFANMLRVAKPTSPMSMGTWLISAFGPITGAAAVSDATGIAPGVGRLCEALAAVLGPAVSTYTAVLTADTAIPAWHEAWRELPFVFAGGSAASAGAAALLVTPGGDTGPARRLVVLGTVLELGADRAMEERLGDLAEPYQAGRASTAAAAAKRLLAAGTVLALAGRRRPSLGKAAAVATLAGVALARWSIFRAGFDSAEDPRFTVEPQRRRLSG